uniref:Uncharacterized protein n=1 Tax=Schistocephalus solidus TaxID=70667 RepID=A0A0X3Q7H5_SCHSO
MSDQNLKGDRRFLSNATYGKSPKLQRGFYHKGLSSRHNLCVILLPKICSIASFSISSRLIKFDIVSGYPSDTRHVRSLEVEIAKSEPIPTRPLLLHNLIEFAYS